MERRKVHSSQFSSCSPAKAKRKPLLGRKKAKAKSQLPEEKSVIRLNSLRVVTDSDKLMAVEANENRSRFAEIFQKYWNLVVGSAIKILGDRDDAQDAASDIFLKVFDRLRIDQPRHFNAWLFMVSRNHCIELLRKRQRAPQQEPIENLRMMRVVEEDEEVADIQQSRNSLVRKALALLTESQRICVELFFIEDMSYKEIAEETGMDLKAIKSHIQNGRRRLTMSLQQSRPSTGGKKRAG